MEQTSLDQENGKTGRSSDFENGLQELQKNKSKGKKMLIAVVILLVLIGTGAAYFLYFNNNFHKIDDGAIKTENSAENTSGGLDKNIDTDKDGLPDYIEKILGMDQNMSDTDRDGYNDLAEIKSGYDPLKSTPDQKLSNDDWNAIKDKIKNTDSSFYESIFLIPGANFSFVCGTSTVKDIDNNIYNTVKIGEQCWLKENLKVTKNPAGNAITRYCYNNDPKICDTDGGLYDWNTTINNTTTEGAQGICPNGWHVPKDSEWYVLENYLNYPGDKCDSDRNGSGCSQAGTRLQVEKEYSYEPHSGFDAIKSGIRLVFFSETGVPDDEHPSYTGRDAFAYFWTSSEKSEFSAWHRLLPGYSLINREAYNKKQAFSVRCLKD